MPRVACAINFSHGSLEKKYNVSNNDDDLMCLLSTKYGIEMVQLTHRGLIRRAVRDMFMRVNVCVEREGRWVERKYTIGQ